jgi:hypothetical protein
MVGWPFHTIKKASMIARSPSFLSRQLSGASFPLCVACSPPTALLPTSFAALNHASFSRPKLSFSTRPVKFESLGSINREQSHAQCIMAAGAVLGSSLVLASVVHDPQPSKDPAKPTSLFSRHLWAPPLHKCFAESTEISARRDNRAPRILEKLPSALDTRAQLRRRVSPFLVQFWHHPFPVSLFLLLYSVRHPSERPAAAFANRRFIFALVGR